MWNGFMTKRDKKEGVWGSKKAKKKSGDVINRRPKVICTGKAVRPTAKEGVYIEN